MHEYSERETTADVKKPIVRGVIISSHNSLTQAAKPKTYNYVHEIAVHICGACRWQTEFVNTPYAQL